MTYAERIVSARELNRSVLSRQHLLERSTSSIGAVLESMGCLQAQYAPSMYVGLWTRLAGFQRRDLTEQLEKRTVVQGTLMRATIHLVTPADYWPLVRATRSARQQWWLRMQPHGATEDDMGAVARAVEAVLADGPIAQVEMEQLVGRYMSGIHQFVDIVRVPPSGTWDRRRANRYASAEQWIGPAPPSDGPESDLEHLVRRYLAGFGPARPKDIAAWAGLKVSVVRPVLVDLPRYRSESGDELVDLVDAVIPHADEPAPVRFLPTWDATLLAHARSAGIIREDDRPRIFHVKNPQSESTFTVDGVVEGTWRHDGQRIVVEAFRPLPKALRAEVDDEAERLGSLFA
jgi:hypothetical protein